MKDNLSSSFYFASRPDGSLGGFIWEFLSRLFGLAPGASEGKGTFPVRSFKELMNATVEKFGSAEVSRVIGNDPLLREKLENLGGLDAVSTVMGELTSGPGSLKDVMKSAVAMVGVEKAKELLMSNPETMNLLGILAGQSGDELAATVERELHNLGAEVEATKGMINGPVTRDVVVNKFREFVADTRAKAGGDVRFESIQHMRLERSERERRDHQTLTLTVLLASNAAYRALHEEMMGKLPGVEKLLDGNQEKLDAIVARKKRELRDLLEEKAARLPDGRFVFRGSDGIVVGEDLRPIDQKDAEGIDFRGKMTEREYAHARAPLVEAVQRAEQNRRDRVELGEIRERNTREENALTMEEKQADKARMDDIEEAGRDNQAYIAREQGFGLMAQPKSVETLTAPTGSMVELKL